jgi:peptidoglycan/LPS O-acetylase OafA/YrhL
MKHIPGLNGLRAIAVTAVVWHHAHAPIAGLPITANGFLGVDVFFVLSGFLITALLLEEREQTGSISLKGFYGRRTLRIFPLYYAVVGLMALYFFFAKGSGQRDAYFAELPANLLYLSNWFPPTTVMGITWSLSTEEQFYLLWPPLFAWLGRRALWILIAFLGVNQAVNFGLADDWLRAVHMPYESRSILQATFTPIILGSMLAFALRSNWRPKIAAAVSGWRLGVILIVMLALASAHDMRGAPRLAFHVMTTAFVAGVVLWPNSIASRALEWRPLVYVGTVSYGVYLWHMIALDPVQRLIQKAHLDPAFWTFPIGMLATVAIAGISFHYFEKPFLRLKGRFSKPAAAALPSATPIQP